MALLKEIITPFGTTANYWRISLQTAPHYPSSDDNVLSLLVTVMCYTNQQARLNLMSPINVLTKSFLLTNEDARNALCNIIETQEEKTIEHVTETVVDVLDGYGNPVLDEEGHNVQTINREVTTTTETVTVKNPDPRPIIYALLKTLPDFIDATDC